MSTLIQQTRRSIDAIREQTDSVILFCSLGKDSIVLLDLLATRFERVVCVFMYFVKGLEHIDRYARWVKSKYKNVEWVEVPHWNLSYIYKNGVYCKSRSKTRLIKLADVIRVMRDKYNLHYVFLGMKKSDSMNRRTMLMSYQKNNYENNGLVYPLADWTQKQILAYIKQRTLIEPVRYSKSASGGLGFNLECFLWMRENAPQDLEKVLGTFPLAKRILFEHDDKQLNSIGELNRAST